MNESIRQNCAARIEAFRELKALNRWELQEIVLSCAGLYCVAGQPVDAERLKASRELLKKGRNIFSDFRGLAEFVLCCKMALNKDPERYLNDVETVYEPLKNFLSDSQTVLAASILADHGFADHAEDAARRTKDLYKQMKEQHPWLTAEEDKPFAALMVVLGRDNSQTLQQAEEAFAYLKKNLSADLNTMQTLSFILALHDGDMTRRCEKLCAMAKGLRKARRSLGGGMELASLGVLVDSELSAEELVEQIVAADDCLKEEKIAKRLAARTRRMCAVQTVAEITMADAKENGIISTTFHTILAVQYAIVVLMCLIIISAT